MNENIETESLGVDNGRVIRAFGQEAHVLVSSEQTGDAFCVLRCFIPAGNVTTPHLHRTTDETFLIESGEIEINRGGELLRGRKGDVIYLPKGTLHALRVIGSAEGVALVVCVVPGGGFYCDQACVEFRQLQLARRGENAWSVIAASNGS